MASILQRSGRSLTSFIGDIGLWVVLIATIIAAVMEIMTMIEARAVKLTDILLLFIYLEVITMIDVYWRTGRLPVRMPLYIAMVALARYIILDASRLGVEHVLGFSAAILTLAFAVLVVRYGHLKLPYPETVSTNITEADESPEQRKRRTTNAD